MVIYEGHYVFDVCTEYERESKIEEFGRTKLENPTLTNHAYLDNILGKRFKLKFSLLM